MLSFSALCIELDCKLTNYRDRWSAYNADKRRGVFTVWLDRLDTKNGRYEFGEADSNDSRIGSKELRRHIEAVIKNGAEAFGILCEARNIAAVPRSRKNFDSETLLTLRFTLERGKYVAYVVGEVSVEAVKCGHATVSIQRWSDAINDLTYEPVGSITPDRVTGTVSAFRRDAKIRDAVLTRANGKCEYCGAPGFEMAKGRRYLEAHHIINLAKQGPDTMDNVIALCANHHREAHYGKTANHLELQLREKLKSLRKKSR
jgi:5-methylcytosine-specific restriction protein A